MKKIFTALFAFVLAFSVLCTAVSADVEPKVFIIDNWNHLSNTEIELLYQQAFDFSELSEMNVMLVISDDIGQPKTDAHTVEYADDLYDEYCGINTDGVLFLINNDTKYDYISTSGSAINYYSDYRIDTILDDTHDYLVGGDYYSAMRTFLNDIARYYRSGKANYQTEIFGMEADPVDFFSSFIIWGFIAAVIGLIIYMSNRKKYQLQKASANLYVNRNTFKLVQNTDTFLGVVTSRVYSPRNSGGSGGSGGGHSSTHHSSGGGRHGGGGRHR